MAYLTPIDCLIANSINNNSFKWSHDFLQTKRIFIIHILILSFPRRPLNLTLVSHSHSLSTTSQTISQLYIIMTITPQMTASLSTKNKNKNKIYTK